MAIAAMGNRLGQIGAAIPFRAAIGMWHETPGVIGHDPFEHGFV